MRKVVVQEFVTLDGFASGPNGELDFISEAGETADPTSGPFVEDQLTFIGSVDTILLGAETYRMFAAYWPEQTVETQRIADALNGTPKVVFSRTLDSAPWGDWPEARLVAGSAEDEIRRLKAESGKDMVLWGGLTLAQSLMRAGLVDEYSLFVCPSVLGEGKRLFADGPAQPKIELVETKQYDGLVALRYRVPSY